MITISEATIDDFETIREIAHKTWPVVYGQILTKEQIDYMLDKMYSDSTLADNITKGHHFILAKENNICLGFTSIEHHYFNEECTRLHKIYLLPESQGKGLGKLMLEKITVLAKLNQSKKISLNVNRFNSAFEFYKKMGFEIIGEEDIAIGNGYTMEDYKMEKTL